jgi:hypothetical protein
MKKKKFTKKQNARFFAMKDRRKRDIEKYGKAYVYPPIYPVKRYDGQGNLIDEIKPNEF